MSKSRDAFRTISEVSTLLDTPAHVLRFWESKFSQIKPVKRAGGRRYYRPDDLALLGGIKALLHDDGMTIKGVQKLLRENGAKHVAAMAADTEDQTTDNDDGKTIEAETDADDNLRHDEKARRKDRDHNRDKAVPQVAATGAPAPKSDPVSNGAPDNIVTLQPAKTGDVPDADDADARAGKTAASDSFPPDAAKPKAAPNPALHPDVTDNTTLSARILPLLNRVDPVMLRRHGNDIAPLVQRLEAVHARMTRR